MLPMASLSRSLAPHLLQLRPLAVPAMSLQTWFAQRSTSTAAGSPADPFVAKMQQKTEQELLELLQKGREGEGAAEQQQQDESEGKAVEQVRAVGPVQQCFGAWAGWLRLRRRLPVVHVELCRES